MYYEATVRWTSGSALYISRTHFHPTLENAWKVQGGGGGGGEVQELHTDTETRPVQYRRFQHLSLFLFFLPEAAF